MFLGFEIANNNPKFKNKFHYKMRFFIKNKTNNIFFFIAFLSIGYTQPTLNPGVLLKNETAQKEEYYFYTPQEESLVLYKINTKSEYYKIWEYKFLKEKKIEPISILSGDITGNGEKELIFIGYVFGQTPEIYIFSTDKNIPVDSPAIYQLTSLKKGSRPMQAALIKWDGDKDKEIAITLSSPERKILLLDYNINKLTPITNKIGEEFMSNTYGPIHMVVADYNQDLEDDLVLYTTTDPPKKHIYFPKTKTGQTDEILTNKDLGEISTIKFNLKDWNKEPVIITKKGEIASLGKLEGLDEFLSKMDLEFKKQRTVDLLNFSNTIVLQLSEQKISQINGNNPKNIISLPQESTCYIYNLKDNTMLFYDKPINNPKLLLVENNMFLENLVEKNPKQKINQEIDIVAESIELVVEKKTIKEKKQQGQPSDTLYINIGDTLQIPIKIALEDNIKSVETTILPKGMFLDSETIGFIWNPTQKHIGNHLFQYNIVSETEPILQINTQDSSQLSLERVSQTEETEFNHLIIVNDIPELQIENKKDTINITGVFSSSYTIQDKIKITEYNVKIIKPTTNTMLIDKETIYWEPNKTDIGFNEFIIEVSDGLAKNTKTISVFVDTTIFIQEDTLIATLNEEFIYQLPYKKGHQYNIVNGPNNLRVSPLGEAHWIPLATQIDDNIIDININTGTQINQHRLNIYVNAPPVISYRPAENEYITQGDTFIFTCQSFDLNISPKLNWSLELPNKNLDKYFFLKQGGEFKVVTDSLLDNQDYTLILSDGLNKDKFFGTLYINSIPKIISTPPNYLVLGDTLNYQIEVVDQNQEKPFSSSYLSTSDNIINYKIIKNPLNAVLDTGGLLSWAPNRSQLGSHSFDIKIADSLTSQQHSFTLFVNDRPNIISIDSLSILVGDTLNHFFDASDLNGESNLIYSIKTTIDELIFSGGAGKLTWVPQLQDLGLHTLEISVSDGFNSSTDTQKLKIFVYKPPILSNIPDSTAYANLEYTYFPIAYDMYNDSIYNKDVFITFVAPDTLFTGDYNIELNKFSWVPSIQDLGLRRLEFIIRDKYNTKAYKSYDINVLMSPCETLDTLYINVVDTVYIEPKNNQTPNIIIKQKAPFSPFP